MDHHQQHHEHHVKEREQEKKEWKAINRDQGGKRRGLHPAWYVVLAVILIMAAVLIWTFLLR